MIRSGALLLLLVLFPAASAARASEIPAAIRSALAHPERSQADRLRDETSHPAEVLAFLGVEPGMTVLDLLAGGGYYSEILARVVGPEGRVFLHNNQGTLGQMRSVSRRLQRPGLEALEIYVREIEDIQLPSNSVDLVLMVKVYHDLYYLNNGWAVGPDAVFRTLHRILKPGGTLGIIDHSAPAGTGSAYAQNLHRIDPDFARNDIESRGFRFTGASGLLANPGDDLHQSPFTPELRGRTDRFLQRYEKVAAP